MRRMVNEKQSNGIMYTVTEIMDIMSSFDFDEFMETIQREEFYGIPYICML